MAKKFRLNVYMAPEFAEEFKVVAKKNDMTFTNLGSICIQLGYAALQMAGNKEFKPYFESALKEIEAKDAKK